MRMNDGVAFAVKGGLLFSLTAKNRTFLFGCLEQQECVKWKTAFSTALALDTAAPPPSAKEHDHEVGGVLQGLKGALGAFADDEPVVEARKPAAPTATAAAAAASAAAPKQATKAPAADDDDPFAAIARRPSKSAPPPTTTAAAPVLDLFGAPAAAPAAAPAPASGASALTGDALMKLYAQSAAVQPHVQTAPPHYANDFFATPASGFGAAPTQAGAFGGFGAPLATAQPQQQPALAPTPAPALAQQQQAKHDPFASLL
jgi:hypothetical protein